jgi:integrase
MARSKRPRRKISTARSPSSRPPRLSDEVIEAWLAEPDTVSEIFAAYSDLKKLLAQVRAHMPIAPRPGREDIPTKDEVHAMLAHATGMNKPLLLVAISCGLSAGELSRLRWKDIDLERGVLTVRC